MPTPVRDQDADHVPLTDPGVPRAAAGPSGDPKLVELNALLGRGTTYSGKLHFEGRIRVEGRFSGEIRGDDILVIGEGAEVDGEIEVGVCIVMGGKVTANIRARSAIELHVPAVVRGDLHAPAIFIDRGVQFEGNCRMASLGAETESPHEAAAMPAVPEAEPR
jgi:cytoskeletal protein CcmA (bactofilin family)